jgi:hypothetical protein
LNNHYPKIALPLFIGNQTMGIKSGQNAVFVPEGYYGCLVYVLLNYCRFEGSGADIFILP